MLETAEMSSQLPPPPASMDTQSVKHVDGRTVFSLLTHLAANTAKKIQFDGLVPPGKCRFATKSINVQRILVPTWSIKQLKRSQWERILDRVLVGDLQPFVTVLGPM